MRNVTARLLRARLFNSIAEHDTIYSDEDGADRTDYLFRNITTRVTFDMLLNFVPDEDKKKPSYELLEPMPV